MKKIDLSDLVCMFAAAILLLMTILSAVGTDRTAYKLWTGILCALFCLIPMLFRHAGVMKLPLAFIVLIEVAIFAHAYGVLLMRYDDIVWYDTVTHTFSTIAVGLCVFYALMAVQIFDRKTRFGPRWIPLLVALIVMTFSIYWEVLELVVDTLTGINMQYSPWDTIRDMVCNSAAALIVTVSARFYLKSHTCEGFIESLELHPSLKRFISRRPKKEGQPVQVVHQSGIHDPMDASVSEGVAGSTSSAARRMDHDPHK